MGLGCYELTPQFGRAMNQPEVRELLQGAMDAGVTFFDTAEAYFNIQGNFSEVSAGRFLRSVPRSSYTLATKMLPYTRLDLPTVSAHVDASLSRLGLEQIDLFYLHRMPSSVEALEEWMRSMRAVVASGRVRYRLPTSPCLCPVSCVHARVHACVHVHIHVHVTYAHPMGVCIRDGVHTTLTRYRICGLLIRCAT